MPLASSSATKRAFSVCSAVTSCSAIEAIFDQTNSVVRRKNPLTQKRTRANTRDVMEPCVARIYDQAGESQIHLERVYAEHQEFLILQSTRFMMCGFLVLFYRGG